MNIGLSILNKALPRQCDLCGEDALNMVCNKCELDLPFLQSACRVCSLPFPLQAREAPEICGECLNQTRAYEKIVSPFVYRDEIAWLVNQFKHGNHFTYGKYLSTFLKTKVESVYEGKAYPELITSVPLHWTRAFQRGFNQSEILARFLATRLKLPYKALLRKIKATPQQQNLNKKARLKNLRDVFKLKYDVTNKYISVVDDVVTTTATAEVLAKILMSAGARRVDIWSLARTPK